MRMTYGLLASILFVCVGGCATHSRVEPVEADVGRVTSHTAAPEKTESPRQALTKSIVIVADTQIHESRGTASRYFSLAGDEFVPVTIRTGQQTIGAADILANVLRRERISPLVLHLGDAIDVSCETEWDLYSTTMTDARGAASPSTWLFTPGNHDGYLVGNFFPLKGQIYSQSYWDEVCNTGRIYDKSRRYRMSKNGVINAYSESLQKSGAVTLSRRGGLDCTGNPMTFCSLIYESKSAPWTSFMIQAVRLPISESNIGPPIFAILLDTSDYATQPRPLGSVLAGINAGISIRQLAAVEALMQALPEQARVFFAGHHPFSAWATDRWPVDAKASLRRIFQSPKSLKFILTAHTHEGGWSEHRFEGRTLLELNTGSLIDWPIYYRELQFEMDANGRLYVNSPQHNLEASLREECKFLVIPQTGSKYSIKDQQSESDRQSAVGGIWQRLAALASAVGHFSQFWKAKHIELGAQLLAYADVVEYSMPIDAQFSYRVPGARTVVLSGKTDAATKLRSLALCEDKVRCPAQEKETVLYALERYYWSTATPESTRIGGHDYRRCAALWASHGAALEKTTEAELVKKIAERTVLQARQLPP